jgi:hypothetical protein
MAEITLHRAKRIEEQIRVALREQKLSDSVRVAIFNSDPLGAINRERERLKEEIGRVQSFLNILARIRAAAGKANAEVGISALLAEKAARTEQISILSKLLPSAASDEPKFFVGRGQKPLARDDEALAVQFSAMKERFSTAEKAGDTSLDIQVLTEEDQTELRDIKLAAERRIEDISDRLRELNSGTRIVIDDADLDYLRNQKVL